jgi:hypothetical protein
MTSERRFTGISVLIPGYSVEDIPTDLDEDKTTGLLNAIACAWHPAVISAADGVPQFRYADLSEIMDSQQILMLPECSEEWLGHDWQPQLESGNCAVLHGLTERREWLEAINRRFGVDHNSIDEALISEFLALGLSWYLVMSLSRRMKHVFLPHFAMRRTPQSKDEWLMRAGHSRMDLSVCWKPANSCSPRKVSCWIFASRRHQVTKNNSWTSSAMPGL